jgi:hypothetical protein
MGKFIAAIIMFLLGMGVILALAKLECQAGKWFDAGAVQNHSIGHTSAT